MARRFGGRYSPGDAVAAETLRPGPSGLAPPLPGRARVTVLMALAALPVLTAFGQPGALAVVGNLAAGGAIFAGAALTREGIRAEVAFAARRVARRPAAPRKLLGAALVGIGVTLAAATGLSGLVAAAVYGLLAMGLHVAAFGPDPMSDKGMAGVDAARTDRVARTIEEAERHLATMADAVRRANDREAEARVAALSARAREMFRTVEDDPRDLSAARRFLGIYLAGARDATIKFADLYAATRDAGAKRDYLALLDDLDRGIGARRERLLLADRTDLDVEIEVLRDRLRADGLPTGD